MTKKQNIDHDQSLEIEAPPLEAASFQIDNLLRFLNQLILPNDLVALLGGNDGQEVRDVANDVIAYRQKSGAFIQFSDLKNVPTINREMMSRMLDASRHQIVSAAIPVTYLISPVAFSTLGVEALATWLPFFPDIIAWRPTQPAWFAMTNFISLLTTKKKWLQDKLDIARKVLEQKKKSLEMVQANVSKADWDDDIGVANASSAVSTADENMKEVEREIGELNEAINNDANNDKPKNTWAIVKANIEAEVRRLRSDIKEEMNKTPPNTKEAAVLGQQAGMWEDKIKDTEREMQE